MTIISLINGLRIRLVNLFFLLKHEIQKLLIFKAVFLSVILVSVSVIEASHADEPDCNGRSCLICHANADEESISLSQLFEIALTLPDLSFSHYEPVHDKAPTIRLPVRGPPWRERGEQR